METGNVSGLEKTATWWNRYRVVLMFLLHLCFSVLPYMNITGKSIAAAKIEVHENSVLFLLSQKQTTAPTPPPPSPAFYAFSDSLSAPKWVGEPD